MKNMKLCLFLIAVFFGMSLQAQNEKAIKFKTGEISKSQVLLLGNPQIQASSYKVFEFDVESLQEQLEGIAHRENRNNGFVASISLPTPEGEFKSYRAVANSTMHPDLAAKFPNILSFDAAGVDSQSEVKWDITPKGLHAMIMTPGESTIFIDPIFDNNNKYYIVYYKKDFVSDKVKSCDFDSEIAELSSRMEPTSGELMSFGTCELRTYRLALAATGEYTAFHGGSAANAIAAQVTTMNRVNGIYERDMAITMTIIANNNLLIYTNTGSDPFTNGNPGTMSNQNQTNTDAVIGSANYDIGHVFGTNSGGLAGLGVVCSNGQKARGVTGSGAPIGDAFDIDYVAHEMGHQFGCAHTFNNSCGGNRNDATAMEPGSGSSIMAYAGICPSNVQNNSDDHFHGISLQQMGIEILSAGHTCEQTSALSNNPPAIISTNGNVNVPSQTPFALTAVVNDPDGDPVSYNWEQMDNGISTQPPVATALIGPNFRSFPSSTNPTRYFPNLQAVANNGPFTWEVIPSVTRTMNFRLSVRDNAPGAGGCNDHTDVTVIVDGNSGPFIVQYPSATGIVWAGASTQTVTWDVANTNNAPVNCATVDIKMSSDGGLTYPYTLATGVANDGSQSITVPNIATTTARVMVINSNGTFFDVSNNNFQITMATFDYTLSSSTSTVSVCQPDAAAFTIEVGQIGGYTDPVALTVSGVPTGGVANFSATPITPAGTSTLTISNTAAITPGTYTLTVSGNSTTGVKTTDVILVVSNGNPTVVTQLTPTNGASGISAPTTFTWTTAPEPGVTYEIDIASDAGFSTIIDQATGLSSATYVSSATLSSTTYYWRVRSATGCGQAAWSSVFSFTTSSCNVYTSTNVGQTTDVASFTSTIDVTGSGTIIDANIASLIISHPWIGDLGATLTSPAGTVINLFDGPGIPASQYGCAGDDIDVSFDDAAAATSATFESTCGAGVPSISGAFQSIDALSTLNGESIAGTWTLTIADSYVAGDVGTLDAWSLELCTAPVVTCNNPDVPTVSGTLAICNGTSTTLSIATGALNDAIDWQWYSGSCGGTAVGNGTSIAVSPTSNTSYFVRGEGGCVVPGSCLQVDVVVNQATTENQSATICTGQTYTFPDGTTGNSNQSYTSLLTSVVTGCDSTIITTLTVVANYNTSESAAICDGETYTFPDGTTGTTAQVYTSNLQSLGLCDSIVQTTLTVNMPTTENVSASICNGDTYTFPDGTTGTTAQTQTSILTSVVTGCDSTIVTALTVNTVNVGVTENAPTLTANAVGAMYQWVDCDNGNAAINAATSASFTPTNLVGNYAVLVTENGCQEMSSCILIDQTGIESLNNNQVKIYPNPAISEVKIEWMGEVNSIELTDARGRLICTYNVSQVSTITIGIDHVDSGVYFIHVFDSNGRSVHDVIKQ